MNYIFILESIGTSELLLIGLVALIVFGPRKIPELARTLGKVMTEFRRSTDDFKKTWEREAGLESGNGSLENRVDNFLGINSKNENKILNEQKLFSPEIKHIEKEDFDKKINEKAEVTRNEKISENLTNKSDWL